MNRKAIPDGQPVVKALRDIDHVRDLADRLRLDRSARGAGALVVEGEKDRRFWKNIADAVGIRVFPLNGRVNVLRMATIVEGEGLRGVLCLADQDFDGEAKRLKRSKTVVFSTNADLEAMLFFSPALERFLEEWASKEKLAEYGGVERLRETIVRELECVSKIRGENAAKGLGLKLDSLSLEDHIDNRTLCLSVERFVRNLERESADCDVEGCLTGAAPRCAYTDRILVRGRDCLAFVGVALRKVVGSVSHQVIKSGLVERTVRLIATSGDIAGSPTYVRVRMLLRIEEEQATA